MVVVPDLVQEKEDTVGAVGRDFSLPLFFSLSLVYNLPVNQFCNVIMLIGFNL